MATFGLRVVVKKSTLAEDYSRSMYNINIKSICIQYFFRILDDFLAFVKHVFFNLIQDFVRLLTFKKILFQKKSNMIYHYKTIIHHYKT